MADDSQIRIGLSIDTSGLSAAQSQAQSSADAIAAAYQRVAAASAVNSEAQAKLGAAAKGGSVQAQAVLAEYAAEVKSATAALDELTAASVATAPALEKQAMAASAAATATSYLGISARQGATAGIGILEGRMMSGNRAAAAFLSTTLGLGPVIQAAFPVIGAIALAEVLAQIGRSAYDAYEKFISLDAVSQKLDDDFRKMQEHDVINVHSIETATERLDQANTAATQLRQTAQDLHNQSLKSFFGDLLQGNVIGAGIDLNLLKGAHDIATDSAKNVINSIALQEKQLELQHQINNANIEAAHAADAGLQPQQRINAELQKRIALAKEEQEYNKRRDQLLGNPTPAGAGDELLKAQERAAGGEAYAQTVNLQKKIVGEFTSEAIADYHKVAQENERIHEEITRIFVEDLDEQSRAMREQEEAERRSAEEWKKDHEQQLKQLQDETDATLKAATIQEDAAKRRIEYEEKLGVLRPKQGAQQQITAINIAESTQVGALRSQQSQYHPEQGEDQATKYKEIQDKITQIQQQSSAQREQIVQQETLQEVAAWQHAMQQMTSAIVSATNTWLTTHKSFGNSFVDAGKRLTVSFIDDILQMGLKWAEHEALMTALHLAGIAQRNTADAAGTATATAAKASQSAAFIAANALIAESDAGVAAATAAAEAAVGGPAAAAAAGAAMLGIMQPFVLAASMATGGIVPGRTGAGVPILAHGGEEVVPGPITSMLANAAQSGKGITGAGHTFNSTYAPQISVLDGKGIESYSRRAGDVHAAEMRRQARRQNQTM